MGVAAGERIGIVGRNGDGKSTLLRLIAVADQPDTGNVTRARDLELALGQGDELDRHRTIRDALVGRRADHEWPPTTRFGPSSTACSAASAWIASCAAWIADRRPLGRRAADLDRAPAARRGWVKVRSDRLFAAVAWLKPRLARRPGTVGLAAIIDSLQMIGWRVHQGRDRVRRGVRFLVTDRLQDTLHRNLVPLLRLMRGENVKPRHEARAASGVG
ncbi:MAG: ATP-binding cassette domain-containing protein [Actinobacteria bacterium]|nr:ATP-binding cassette domain-containing protein [Actinomycetota bacterium]